MNELMETISLGILLTVIFCVMYIPVYIKLVGKYKNK